MVYQELCLTRADHLFFSTTGLRTFETALPSFTNWLRSHDLTSHSNHAARDMIGPCLKFQRLRRLAEQLSAGGRSRAMMTGSTLHPKNALKRCGL